MSFGSSFGLERIRAALVLLALAIPASPLSAQDRLFIGTGEIGAFGRFGERIGTAPEPVYGRFAGGGRYVVGGQSYEPSPSVFDTRTGQPVAMPPGLVLAVDPIRPRLFVKNGGQLAMWHLEARVLTPLLMVVPEDALTAVTTAVYAAQSDELFVWSRRFDGSIVPVSVVAIGSATVVRTLAIDNDIATSFAVTPDGTRLVVPYLGRGEAVLYDGRTGVRLAGTSVASLTTPVYDARFDRWYDAGRTTLTAFDRDLNVIASVPLAPGCGETSIAVSPHTDRLYVVDASGGGGGPRNEPLPVGLRLLVFDTARATLIGSHDVGAVAGVPPESSRCEGRPVAVLTAPAPPAGLSAVVAGHDVTLAWTNVGDASSFVLDVGLAPGRTDLTFSIGATSPVTIPNAPPGTYYLRVRGTNTFGVSRPSREVAVTVP